MANSENLTRTSIDRFRDFMKFLADNQLMDAAAERLKAQGYTELVVSVEPIREVQKMIEEKFKANPNVLSPNARQVILSGHNNDSC